MHRLQNGHEFYLKEQEHLNQPPFYFHQLPFAQYCHDATWALAWTLNKTLTGIAACSYMDALCVHRLQALDHI